MTKITARSVLKHWVDETSFHGVKDIRDSEYKVVKIAWLIALVGAAIYFGYQTYCRNSKISTVTHKPFIVQENFKSMKADFHTPVLSKVRRFLLKCHPSKLNA